MIPDCILDVRRRSAQRLACFYTNCLMDCRLSYQGKIRIGPVSLPAVFITLCQMLRQKRCHLNAVTPPRGQAPTGTGEPCLDAGPGQCGPLAVVRPGGALPLSIAERRPGHTSVLRFRGSSQFSRRKKSTTRSGKGDCHNRHNPCFD